MEERVHPETDALQYIEKTCRYSITYRGVYLCDGAAAYNKLSEAKKCQKIVLNTHKDYSKACHLNTIDGLHSRPKVMLYRYRGVSSKCPNRYLALDQAGRSVFHPEVDSICQLIAKVNTVRRVQTPSAEAVLAF